MDTPDEKRAALERSLIARMHPRNIFATCNAMHSSKRMTFGKKVSGNYWIRKVDANTYELGERDRKVEYTRTGKTKLSEEAREFRPFATITPELISLDLKHFADRRVKFNSQMSHACEAIGLSLAAWRNRSKKRLCWNYALFYVENWQYKRLIEAEANDTLKWDGERLWTDDPIPVRTWDKTKKDDLNSLIRMVRKHLVARANLGVFSFLYGFRRYDAAEALKQRTGQEYDRYVPNNETLVATFEAVDPENLESFYQVLIWSLHHGYWSWQEKIDSDTDWRKKFDSFVRAYKENMLRETGTVVYSVAPEASLKEHNEPDDHPDHAHSDVELQPPASL